MMWIYNNLYIAGNELIYYMFWGANILIAVLALVFTAIELKKEKNNK